MLANLLWSLELALFVIGLLIYTAMGIFLFADLFLWLGHNISPSKMAVGGYGRMANGPVADFGAGIISLMIFIWGVLAALACE